jgi:hypothetical protein
MIYLVLKRNVIPWVKASSENGEINALKRVFLCDYYDAIAELHGFKRMYSFIFLGKNVRYYGILERIHCQNGTIARSFFLTALKKLF